MLSPRHVLIFSSIAWMGLMCVRAAQHKAPSDEQSSKPLVRQQWTTSRITGSPEAPPPFRTQQVFDKLKFHQPVDMTRLAGSNRLFVVEQAGKIFSFPAQSDVERADLLIDLKSAFKKLVPNPQAKDVTAVYGLIFHPQFEQNRYCYITYALASQQSQPLADGARLSRFKVTQLDPPQCDPESEEVVLTWLEGGHMGGAMAFGPDGMLYVSTGDAGPAAPPDERSTGQGVNDLLSCILRIDVDHRDGDRAYRIPPDNPFVGMAGAREEIWAYGFRNPWKMSFDRAAGDLWTGDVGWELWELVYHVERGGNYGWSIMEGPQAVRSDVPIGPTPILPPHDALPHSISASITGGYVYRGKRFPDLVGSYIYGDWETRRLWSARVESMTDSEGKRTVKLASRRDLTEPAVRLVTFCEDNDGELYLVDYDLGTIHELIRNETPDNSQSFPRKLSDTGLFDSVVAHKPAVGVLPFSITAEQWCDGATAERFVAVPESGSIELLPKPEPAPGSMFERIMEFPKDTVFAKTLSLALKAGDAATNKRIETQVLHFDGREFRGYSYAWNDGQTDAELVAADGDEKKFTIADPAAPGGKRTIAWTFFSRTQCLQCHNPWARHTLAFNTLQLDRDHEYDGARRNQLEALRELGVFVPAQAPSDKDKQAADSATARLSLVDPHDKLIGLDQRARSYLHANCAHCHRFGGGGSAKINLAYDQKLEGANVIEAPPTQGRFGIADAAIIKAGDPYRSLLYFRMATVGRGHMPHLGAEQIDERGRALIHDWIRAMAPGAKIDDGLVKLRDLDAALSQSGGAATAKERSAAINELLASASSALMLSAAIAEEKVSTPTRAEILKTAAGHSDMTIRDLFGRFLPDEARAGRLGLRIKPNQILALKGDIEAGRALFFGATALQCKTCHRVKDEGGRVGPDLTSIGKKLNREQLLESMVEPSKTIAQEHRTHLFETSDGRSFTGIIVSREDKEVVFRDAQDKETRLATDEIEQSAAQPQSIMPEGLLRDLTPQQAADLVEYLYSLK